MIRIFQIAFFIPFLAHLSNAQKSSQPGNHLKSRHFILVMEVQHLRSSHSQTIYGASTMLGYRISPSLSAGIGCEISHIDSLFTHDPTTTVLEFTPLPVYLETRLDLIRNSKVTPCLNLSAGMSSITYDRKLFNRSGGIIENKTVHQDGFFLKGGFGLLFNISKYISPSINASFKGFHFSRNTSEINPHGVTIQLGLVIRNP